MRLANRNMVRRYEDDLRLFRGRQTQIAMLVLALVWLFTPILVPDLLEDEFWLSVLNFSGVAAIGAISLNLLTGYTGQVSLGHAFFFGVGAYSAGYLGVSQEWPLYFWLPAAAVLGGLIGAVVGPFALRLRGNYLVIVTLGLVFVGLHLFRNWDTVTGGSRGTPSAAPLELGPFDVRDFSIFGNDYSFNQAFFWFVWLLVAVVALLAKNLVRSRPGRAMQAVRDRDVAAEVIGVSLARYKIGAFAVSSALAAVAGGLQGSLVGFSSPDTWNLFLSIQYIAIIIVGGVGTIFGSILGAVFIGALPRVIERFSDDIPFVNTGLGTGGIIEVAALNRLLFGVLIVVFLVTEPHGLAALWLRIKAYFRTWPFSY